MNELTDAEREEFWERCGFTKTDVPITLSDWHSRTDIYKWFEPNASGVSPMLNSLPPTDLNNLFKYAVPKAIKIIMAQQECDEELAYAILFKHWLQIGYDALALLRAVREVLNQVWILHGVSDETNRS